MTFTGYELEFDPPIRNKTKSLLAEIETELEQEKVNKVLQNWGKIEEAKVTNPHARLPESQEYRVN